MPSRVESIEGPHQGQPVLTAGVPLDRARAVMVMVHGRGATANDILTVADELAQPEFAYLAPQAAGNTWYPNSFLAPISSNEPGLSSGFAVIVNVLAQVSRAGIPRERTMLLGFSQGACLTLEFAARHARRYGGLAGLSGGLVGPDGILRDYAGRLLGTPVLLGCSDVDPHIPKKRVQHTAEVLRRLGGDIIMRLYPNMGHEINQDEIGLVRGMMAKLV